MFFTLTNQIRIHTPLLFLAVFAIVFAAVFSPVLSNNAEAQTIWDCDESLNISECYTTKDICEVSCPSRRCFKRTITDPSTQCNTGRIIDKINFVPSAEKVLSDPGGAAVEVITSTVLEGLIELLKLLNAGLVWLVAWIAQLLDAAIGISLAGLGDIQAITIGWEITRDVANIFFIFILLIIAIATILRLEQYGAKQLLPKLIIIALLINFSLVIAFFIVDASNILALGFIDAISKPSVSNTIAAVLQINKIQETGEPTKSNREIPPSEIVSTGMVEGLQKYSQSFTVDEQVFNAAPATAQNPYSAYVIEFFWQATILILMLTLIFVFVALSAMLLIRSVALIIIFVLAPLGFLAGILPQTRGYSTQWWQKLFSWAFFFPAVSFMIYLALQYGAQMSQVFGIGSKSQVLNTGLLFNYFVTVALLIGSLIVAKQMGGAGAAAAIGLTKRASQGVRRLGQKGLYYGYRGATAPVRAGARAAGRGIGDWAGRKLEGTAGTIPIVRGALSRMSAAREKSLAEEMKRFSHLSPAALANMQGGLTGMSYEAGVRTFAKLRPEEQRRYADTMGPDKFNKFAQVVGQRLGAPGQKLAAKATGDVHEAMRILHRDQFGDMAHAPAEGEAGYEAYQQQANDYFSSLTTKEIGMLSANTVRTSDALREYIFKNSENMKELLTKREHIQAFSENLNDHLNKNITLMTLAGVSRNDQIANEIKAKGGHHDLEQAFRSGIGVNIVLNPSTVRVGTKRGIVTTVTAEGE